MVAGNLLHVSTYRALNVKHIVSWTLHNTFPFCSFCSKNTGPILITSCSHEKKYQALHACTISMLAFRSVGSSCYVWWKWNLLLNSFKWATKKNPPFLNPLPPSLWNHGCSKVQASRHMISVISHLWPSYKCTLTLNTMIFSPSDPSRVWMALHYQANLVDDVTVGASLTLKNQHGTKRQL